MGKQNFGKKSNEQELALADNKTYYEASISIQFGVENEIKQMTRSQKGLKYIREFNLR